MILVSGEAIEGFGQAMSGLERFFALEMPHQHLARFRRWFARFSDEQILQVRRSHRRALSLDH